jgi:LacI family transcriptional regulator
MRTQKRVTIKEIAAATGFTANTVSQALRGSKLVAEATRLLIEKTADEMGYISNMAAGVLRSGKSYTIAILYGDISNLFFSITAQRLIKLLRAEGYHALILNTDEDAMQELQSVKTAISKNVDGVIICPCQQNRAGIDLLEQRGIPYVLMGRHFGDGNTNSVVWDDRQGGRLATEHLIRQGCRDILLINAPMYISSAKERAYGYMQALKAADIAVRNELIYEISALPEDVERSLEEMCLLELKYDGVFAFNDIIAWMLANYFQKHNIAVPEKVKLIGYDDIQGSTSIPVDISSVSTDIAYETELIVRLLLDQIKEPGKHPPRQLTVNTTLVPRASSGC